METAKNPQETPLTQTPVEDQPLHENLFRRKVPVVLIAVIAVILLTVITGFGSFKSFNFKSNTSPSPTKVIQQNVETKCEYYGILDKDFYLNKYVVQKGDTLLSIAQNQLNDSSRIDELIELNKQLYPTLSIRNPYIAVGWELRIPPQYFSKSSGILEGVGGQITEQNDKSITINLKKDKIAKQINYLTPSTRYLSVSSFKIGDCIYIVKDNSARAEAGILAISPQDKNYFLSTQPSEIKQQGKGKCEFYGFLDKDFFLTQYIVKRGDNVSSIAAKELGDATRTEELIQLNKTWYPHLTNQTPFIEVGWQLRIPPKMFTKSSGALVGIGGEILEKTDNSISINLAHSMPGIQDGYFSHIGTKTKYLGRNSFNVGDCVYAIEDTGINENIILGISPQDKNYFK